MIKLKHKALEVKFGNLLDTEVNLVNLVNFHSSLSSVAGYQRGNQDHMTKTSNFFQLLNCQQKAGLSILYSNQKLNQGLF